MLRAGLNAVGTRSEQAPALAAEGTPILSTDERTGIQAFERTPVTPMRPGDRERVEFESLRHGPQWLLANFEVVSGQGVAATVSETRTEADVVAHLQQTVALDREAPGMVIPAQLKTHTSESLVPWVAEACGIPDDLGVKGTRGILHSMASRAAFLSDPTPRIRIVSTPKHASWLNQSDIGFSLLVRRLLKRGNVLSQPYLKERMLGFIAYFHTTFAKPFQWTYKGKALTIRMCNLL